MVCNQESVERSGLRGGLPTVPANGLFAAVPSVR